MRKAYNIVQSELKGTTERMKKRYDKRIKTIHFNEGKFVYYYSPRAPPGRGRKFRMYTSGPFRVMKRINKVNYRIQKNPRSKPFIVHIDRITRYYSNAPKCWASFVDERATVNIDKSSVEHGSRTEACRLVAYPSTL